MNLIFGNHRYAALVRHELESFGKQKVSAYLVDRSFIRDEVLDLPQLAIEDLGLSKAAIFLGVTFENKKGPDFTKSVVKKLLSKGLIMPGFNHSNNEVGVKIGAGSQIFHSSQIDDGTNVGSFVQIRPNTYIGHDCDISSFTYISPSVNIGSYASIEEGCFLGFGCTIAPNTKIRARCIIAAGAVVRGEVPANTFVFPSKQKSRKMKNPYRLI